MDNIIYLTPKQAEEFSGKSHSTIWRYIRELREKEGSYSDEEMIEDESSGQKNIMLGKDALAKRFKIRVPESDGQQTNDKYVQHLEDTVRFLQGELKEKNEQIKRLQTDYNPKKIMTELQKALDKKGRNIELE